MGNLDLVNDGAIQKKDKYVRKYAHTCMYVCMCTYVCMYVCMHACMYVIYTMNVCAYRCVCV